MVEQHSIPLEVVATLGPGSTEPAVIRALARVVGRFRLNASHLDADSLTRWLELLDGLYRDGCDPRPVVVDLQGAKMRVGRLPAVAELPTEVTLVHADRCRRPGRIPVPHAELFDAVSVGQRLVLNDARVELVVTARHHGELAAQVVRDGPLSSRKGINRADHPLPYTHLLRRDLDMIRAARRFGGCQFAFSFALDGNEAALLRAETDAQLVGKVERAGAMDRLDALDRAFDELWFCRGDLGSQVGLAGLGEVQRRFVDRMPGLCSPCLLAGQVLEHLTHHPEPTRSEVVHLYDASRAGWSGVVLSDETAMGDHPLDVARLLAELPFVAGDDPSA